MAKLPVRLVTPADFGTVSGGVANRNIAHFDEIAVVGSGVTAANVSGGVVPLSTDEYLAMLSSAISGTAIAYFKYNTGITVTGSGVSQWSDVTGNANHLLQGTDAARPALQADGSILFNGTSHFLKCTAFTLNQPTTVVIVFKQGSWTGGDYVSDGNTSGSMVVFQASLTPQVSINAGSTIGPQGMTVGTYGVFIGVFNGASSSTQLNAGSATTGNAGANNAGGFTLGANATPANYGNIQVYEAAIFPSALSVADRARVASYLMAKFSIA